MNIFHNQSLKDYNSFQLDVACKTLIIVSSEKHLTEVLPVKTDEIFVLGGGSNILLTGFVDKIVLKNEIAGIKIKEEDDTHVLLEVGTGEIWHDLVLWAIENDFGGIENLALIPGTVGAAPIQNIGAYGVELEEVFIGLEAYKIDTGDKRYFTKEECQFGYRDSIYKKELKSEYFITRVLLQLTKRDHKLNTSYGAIRKSLEDKNIINPTIEDVSITVISIRKSKLPDPKIIGNCGSFFKNPEISKSMFLQLQQKFPKIIHYSLPSGDIKIPAGWLIEQCNWKGKKVGNVGCYKKQALVIVNYGGATSKEIVDLSNNIRESVFQKFEIALETEVSFI